MTGVDISAGMLAQARQVVTATGLANIDLVQADATSLARFPDGSFDLVLCSAGLLYIPIQAALREWKWLLADLLHADPGRLLGSEVIYAFGRKPSLPRPHGKHRPLIPRV